MIIIKKEKGQDKICQFKMMKNEKTIMWVNRKKKR